MSELSIDVKKLTLKEYSPLLEEQKEVIIDDSLSDSISAEDILIKK